MQSNWGRRVSDYLWYCSLKNKVCHIRLCWVGSMNGDDGDVRIGIGSLKCEVYFQTILVVRCHRRNTCALVSEEQIIPLFTFQSFFRQCCEAWTSSIEHEEKAIIYVTFDSRRPKGNSSPAAAMSLNRGGEERPSRRKEGWEVGTEGAGAGGGPPGRGEQQHSMVSDYYFHTKVSMCYCLRCVGTR